MAWTAWDGKQYEGEPPADWSVRADGRWWPEGHGPTATATPPPVPSVGSPPPIPGAVAAPATPPPIAGSPGLAATTGPGGGSGRAGAGLALLLVLGVAAFLVIGIAAFWVLRGSGDDAETVAETSPTTEAAPSSERETADDGTSEAAEPTTTLAPETTSSTTTDAGTDTEGPVAPPAIDVVTIEETALFPYEASTDDPLWADSMVRLTNSADAPATAEILVTVFDADGNELDTETIYAGWVPPQGEITLSNTHIGLAAPAASMEAVVFADAPYAAWDGEFTVRDATIAVDEYYVRVSGVMVNDTDVTPEQMLIQCGLFEGGALVLQAFTYPDVIGPGSETGFTALTDPRDAVFAPDEVRCVGIYREAE